MKRRSHRNPTENATTRTMWRSVSPDEMAHIIATGRITGRGNAFARDDRDYVFFGIDGPAEVMHHGEDTERQVSSAMEPEGWPLFGNEAQNNHSVDGASWNDRFRQLEDAGEPFAWWRAHVETWSRGDGRMRGVESPHAPVLAILLSGLQLTSIEGGVASLRCPPIGSP